ncbi:MAG: catalase family peroxidase [Actinobacteria bacterium]|nr:catalase family peroxidase [Actinomycetota bacterium]
MANLAREAFDAIRSVSGSQPGHRAAHAKGRIYRGRFTATPAAGSLTRAAHMQGEPVEATVRVSNGGGRPDGDDRAKDGRGLATKFYLPDGSRTDIVAVTLPRFFVRTPEEFVPFTRARRSGLATALYLATHPRTAVVTSSAAKGLVRPPSYANCRYNGLHAFRWIAADGSERYVRYSWVPEAGEEQLSAEDASDRDRNFLQDEFAQRLEGGPVRFGLRLQIARDGDPVDDPTRPWPDERETVEAGTLEITAPDTERERGDDVLVFDPTRVTDGIELSGDRILKFRRAVYALSVEDRSGIVLADPDID